MPTDNTTVIILLLSIFFLFAAAVIAFLDLYSRRRSLRRMRDMIQSAIDGTFRADTFDESLTASVENKLAEYLAASETQLGKTAAEQEKTKTLIADISHQTKTPIANLLLYTELLKEEGGRDSETVALLGSQVRKLDFLIQSLVKLSRLESGMLEVRPEKNKIRKLIAGLDYAAAAEQKGISLSVGEVPELTAFFDLKWTLEALSNIVDNAIKYTPAGGSVAISVKEYEMFARIDIEDTGIGMEEEETAKIFARFYRSPAVSGESGVGIGLYLVREILGREGGYVKVASRPGKGSVFSVFLGRI